MAERVFLPDDLVSEIVESHEHQFIDIPYFFPKLLFRIKRLPLGKIFHIIGEQASLKSTFAAEVARWHLMAGGSAFFIDTEGKDARHIYKKLLKDIDQNSYRVMNVKYLEDWLKIIGYAVIRMEEAKEKGHKINPTVFVIDSVLGANSIQTLMEMKSRDNYCMDRFSKEAKYISDTLRTLVSRLSKLPITLIFVNHKKLRIGHNMVPIKATLGGSEIKFYSSFELDLSKSKGEIYLDGTSEYMLTISVEKNSFGPEKIAISVPVTFDREGVKFEWYVALVEWLTTLSSDFVRAKRSNDIDQGIRSIFDISVRSGGRRGKLYYCDSIGITSDKAMPPDELGKLIEEEHKDRLAALERILSISSLENNENS